MQDLAVKPVLGKILRNIDGNTYVLQMEEGTLKVRMDRIDVPESDQVYGEKEGAVGSLYH